jgi:hypothetical protein
LTSKPTWSNALGHSTTSALLLSTALTPRSARWACRNWKCGTASRAVAAVLPPESPDTLWRRRPCRRAWRLSPTGRRGGQGRGDRKAKTVTRRDGLSSGSVVKAVGVAPGTVNAMSPNLTMDRTEQSRRTLPFVEAAKRLIRAVVEAGDGERRVEPLESLVRRMRSWEKFKKAAKQWCERHGEQ